MASSHKCPTEEQLEKIESKLPYGKKFAYDRAMQYARKGDF